MPHFPYDRLKFLGSHPVLFQELGGGLGNPERFALREMHRSRLAIKDKTQVLFGMRPTGVTGF